MFISINKKFRLIFRSILYFIFDFIYLYLLPSKKKQILMVAPNVLTFAYLKLLYKKLKNEENISVSFCFDKDIPDTVVKKMLSELELELENEKISIKVSSYRFSMFFPWALIFFADITAAHQSFSARSKKIRLEHGLPAGKADKNGYSVIYSEGLLDCNGQLAYDAIFSSSRNIPLTINPKLPSFFDTIKYTGCLRMDHLLENNFARSEIRKNLNIPGNKCIVFITSSWGNESLIAQWGKDFYNQLSLLSHKYHFIVTVHPHNYRHLHYRGKITENTFKSFKEKGGIVITPEQDWVPYLACADILLTDYTSLSLYFVALKRPIVCLKLPESLGVVDAEMYRMEKISTSINNVEQLEDSLDKAMSSVISEDHVALAGELCVNKGQAWKHMRLAIWNILEE